MKLSSASSSAVVESAAVGLVFLTLLGTAAASIDCHHIRVDGQDFNFGELSGPHSVITSLYDEPFRMNTTYTLDLCRNLVRKGGELDKESCPNGARVCAITHQKTDGKDTWDFTAVRTIAGNMENSGGNSAGLDEQVKRLKTSDSISDSKKEGVRIIMSGGRHPLNRKGTEQRAIIEMVCDPDKEGTEGEVDPKGDYVKGPPDTEDDDANDTARRLRRADGEEGDQEGGDDSTEQQLLRLAKNDTALIFEGFGAPEDNGNLEVLRLTWRTKWACERDDQKGGEQPGSTEHWGFFTWFIMIVFLGTASYLIFGSWLNYSRYGARGWDLLPHGDTIRDIPYLLKDWTRRVLNTVQGTGSRGGYSAV